MERKEKQLGAGISHVMSSSVLTIPPFSVTEESHFSQSRSRQRRRTNPSGEEKLRFGLYLLKMERKAGSERATCQVKMTEPLF